MIRCRKVSISIIALLTLVALKICMDLTYTSPPFIEHSKYIATEPDRNLLALLEPIKGDEDLSTAAILNLAQRLRKVIISCGARWNTEQLQLLDMSGAKAWTCSDSTSRTRPPEPYPDLLQSFVAHSQCRNHRFIINQPDKCPQNRTFLLLAIKSLPQNFAQRQAIRDSWGAEKNYGGKHVRLVFLLGMGTGPDLSPLLQYESGHSRDILQWDFTDTFFNLTLKDQLFLGWANTYCSGANYILKGDDDVFAQTPKIIHVLSLLHSHRHDSLYMGHVVKSAKPFRDPKNKYYIPQSFYVGFYPPYAGGGGYVFSGALTRWLYLVSQFVVPFPIDDVYTGMCFMALGVHPVGHPGFKTFNVPGGGKSSSCLDNQFLLIHKKSPQEMLKMWGQHYKATQQC